MHVRSCKHVFFFQGNKKLEVLGTLVINYYLKSRLNQLHCTIFLTLILWEPDLIGWTCAKNKEACTECPPEGDGAKDSPLRTYTFYSFSFMLRDSVLIYARLNYSL